MNTFSPCNVQTIGHPNAALSGPAMAISIEFEISSTSGRGWSRSQCTSLSSSFRWCPCVPSSTDTVRAPSCSGRVSTARPATARSSQGDSHSRSSSQGVLRNNETYCSRYTLMPPKNTRCWLTFVSSVRVGV